MTFTAPTQDDLNAIADADSLLAGVGPLIADASAKLEIVHARLSVPVEPPPPPVGRLPEVGVGGSGAWLGLKSAKRKEYLALMKAAGITYFRFTVSWSTCEQVKGVYKLDGPLAIAQEIIDAGLKPQALVGWCPPAYRSRPTAGANSAPKNDEPTRLAWEAFLRELLPKLYAIGVRRIEVWNEPNFAFMQPVSPEVWADLVLIANMVASDISRHLKIISGGVCPAVDRGNESMGASAFFDAVLRYEPEFFRYVDEVAIHPYAGDHNKMTDGQFWTKHVTYLRSIVPAEVPLCGTEHGWKSGKNTEAERCVLYADSIVSWPEAAPVFVFSVFDFAELYGLLKADGTPKPLYGALKLLLTGK